MMLYEIFSNRGAQWRSGVLIVVMSFFTAPMRAQVQSPSASPPAPPVAPQTAPPLMPQPPSPEPRSALQPFTQEQLKQLVAPIALYPDALIALILPASTVPSDLVLAARFVSSKGDPAQAANQPWDDSVKSLVRYPDIVKWMDQNLEWTTQLGEAFLDQPADVMNIIQQLRAQARAAGTLVDTPQQKVVEEETYIRIVPAEPEVIYVPQYDPQIVYADYEESYYGEPYYGGPYYGGPYSPGWGPGLTFGIGFAVGPWLNYDCDWSRRKVCVGDWNPRWRHDRGRGWRDDWQPQRRGGDVFNVVTIASGSARDWEPSPKIRRQHWQRQRRFDSPVNGRRAEGRNTERRSRIVARPSSPDFDGRGEQFRRGAERRRDEGRGGRGEQVRRDDERRGASEQVRRGERRRGGGEQVRSGGARRGGGEQVRSGGARRGGGEQVRSGGARRGGGEQVRSGGARRGGGEQVRSGGARRGGGEQMRSGGARRGGGEQVRSGGARRGGGEQVRSGGARRGGGEQMRSGGARRGGGEQVRSGGARRGGGEQVRSGGARRGGGEQVRSGGGRRGGEQVRSGGARRGGGEQVRSGGGRRGGGEQAGGGGGRRGGGERQGGEEKDRKGRG